MYDKVMVVPTNDNCNNQADYYKKSASTDNLETLGYVRKYMNGAIYIESSIDITAEFEPNEAPPSIKHDDNPIKRISCSCTSIRSCKIHEKSNEAPRRTSATTNNLKKECKPKVRKIKTALDDEPPISTATTTVTLPDDSDLQKEEIYKKWLIRKAEEKKRIEENKIFLQAKEEEQKQKRLEQERGNFKRWLSYKKQEEEKRKLEKEREIKKKEREETKKERRNMECKLRYQLWLKTKEQEDLEKQLKKQREIMKITEEKQNRIDENEKVFKSWLETSKNKPKPIASGQGLLSMQASASVTYINPVPWSPNIDEHDKPVSQ